MPSDAQDFSLFHWRTAYENPNLHVKELGTDPLVGLRKWLEAAQQAQVPEPNAAILSTVNAQQTPQSRAVLIKSIHKQGLRFFTNYNSVKAQDIAHNPQVSLVFLWLAIGRQVRLKGLASPLPHETNAEYFASRPKNSQLAALCSAQSQPTSAEALQEKYDSLSQIYANKAVPCPKHWGGYHVHIHYAEFWQGKPNRLHDRIAYTYQDERWAHQFLAP